jgi:DNA-directed RNA polymerase I and III subunit RPAC2
VSVFDVLRKGLQDLADMCDVIEEKFVAARDDFKVTNPDGGPGRKDELRERSN